MPGGSGLELVSDLLAINSEMEIVVLTGYGSIATAVEATRRGAVDYLTKPADADQILAAFEKSGKKSAAKNVSAGMATVPSLGRVEWEHIQRILTDCGGNISQAARVLGIHRRSLQRKLSKYPPEE
jgi:two-component system response regulator RegA